MAAITYTAAIQVRAAALLGLTYSTTSPFNKTLIDNTWTTGVPGGMAGDALTHIQQYGQWFSLTTPVLAPGTSAGTEWDAWLVARTAMMAAKVIHPERGAEFRGLHDYAETAALDAFARNLITYDTGATPEASVLTIQNIRNYVVSNIVRRRPGWETVSGEARQKPREFVPFEVIDAHIERVIRRIWQYGDWSFARRLVRFTLTRYTASNATWTAASKTLSSVGSFSATIPAGATATVSTGTGATLGEYVTASGSTADAVVLTSSLASGNLATGDITVTVVAVSFVGLIPNGTNPVLAENFAAFASRRVYFDDSSSQGANFMEWFKDSDETARRKAYDVNSGVTGRPRYFMFTENSGNLTWQFHPSPDQTYTGNAVVLIKGPTLDTLTLTTTSLARFPDTFNHVIKDAVLAETLRHLQDPMGQDLWKQVTEEIERMLPIYCDPGASDNDSLDTRDVYNDLAAYTGGSSTMGGWM